MAVHKNVEFYCRGRRKLLTKVNTEDKNCIIRSVNEFIALLEFYIAFQLVNT